MESQRFTLNKSDILKIVRGAGYALAGALLTYITSIVTHTDFGSWTPVIVSVWSIIANAGTKYIGGPEDSILPNNPQNDGQS